jgi:uridylate kinase
LKLVLKFGGFIFPADLDSRKIRLYADLIKKLRKQGHRMIVVAGGGETARRYIEAARTLGASESVCDQLGIYVARLNARLLIEALEEEAYPEVPENVEELRRFFASGRVVAMGGLQPGHSTNAVAVIVAETVHADALVNVTDVEGVYTQDPTKYPKARKLDQISTRELLSMVLKGGIGAGEYELVDPLAVRMINRSRIPTWIVSGKDPSNIERVLRGEKVGTKIIP